MYKIIGADGREYGPVSAEQLRQWIAEGRANAQTKVQAEGSGEWKALGEWPEFVAPSGAATGGAPPPIPSRVSAEAMAAEILTRDYQLNVGACLGRGWELVMNNFWLLVGASFLINLIVGSVGIIGGPLMGGLYWLFLKRIRGEPAQLGDAFAGFSMGFLPLFLAYLVIVILGLLGLLCCLIPGVYLLVSWAFALPLIIDRKLDFWPAMELSRKIVSRHWWLLFGFILLCILVRLLGLLACCIGVFVTTPIATAALMYAYEDIFGRRTASTTA
jgi:hypothetical protein